MGTINATSRRLLKKLLIPQLGSNPSSRVVEPFVGPEAALTLPTTNSVSQTADWIVHRLCRADTAAPFIRTVEILDNGSTEIEPLVALAHDLGSGAQTWRPAFLTIGRRARLWAIPIAVLAVLGLGWILRPPDPFAGLTTTLGAGTYPAGALVDHIAANAGGILIASDLQQTLKGQTINFPEELKDVALKPVLDSIFERLNINVDYVVEDNTIVIKESTEP